MPAWDLIDLNSFPKSVRMTPTPVLEAYAPLFTSRGCPYNCIYCHSIFGKKFRAKSATRVVDEIEHLIKVYGVRSFEVFDDIFNLDYNRVVDICDEIKRRGLDTRFSFPNAVRGDLLDERLIRKLRSVGTYHMAFAVETATPRLQKLIKKNIRLDKIRKNIEIAGENGILTWGFFMLGFPNETRREIWRTIRWALTSKLHGAFFFAVIPQEGTALAEMAGAKDPKGRLSFEHNYHYTLNSLSQVGPWELSLTQTASFGLFFFDPRRMARLFIQYPTTRRDLAYKGLQMVKILLVKEAHAARIIKRFSGQDAETQPA